MDSKEDIEDKIERIMIELTSYYKVPDDRVKKLVELSVEYARMTDMQAIKQRLSANI